MTKLCARGKAAAKRKFKVYPSAYANAYASKICAGKAKDPSGLKRKDWGPKKASEGAEIKVNKVIKGLKKASKTHAAQAKTLQTVVKASDGISVEKLKIEAQKIIDNFPKEKKYNYKKPKKKPYNLTKPTGLGRAMTLDTTTNISGAAVPLQKMCGGEVRGSGAANRGTKFKGVF
jgi:hypothetical protein